jgi:enamine deaminase RidA (YjgF/YER057c/UK114 family)
MFEAVSSKQRLMPSEHWDWHVKVPMSQGWRLGNVIFVGGQLSLDGDGNTIGVGDIETQTRNVFENISRVLAEAGASWADVIKLNTYYVYDGDEDGAQAYWEAMTKVRMEYLCDPGPAATAVRVPGLMYGDLLIEAEVIAYVEPPAADGNGAS